MVAVVSKVGVVALTSSVTVVNARVIWCLVVVLV